MNNLDFNTGIKQAAMFVRANGITQSSIAAALYVSQSQVSRVLSGSSKKHTKLVDEICIYIDQYMHKISPSLAIENPEINEAIGEVWDGSSGHAHAIAEVIRSLRGFTKASHLTSSQYSLKEEKNDYP